MRPVVVVFVDSQVLLSSDGLRPIPDVSIAITRSLKQSFRLSGLQRSLRDGKLTGRFRATAAGKLHPTGPASFGRQCTYIATPSFLPLLRSEHRVYRWRVKLALVL